MAVPPRRKPGVVSAVWCCVATPALFSKDWKLKVQFREMGKEW